MFRLLSLTILNHQVLGNIHLDFCQNENRGVYPENIYTSVIIGENGIGKSHLMRVIADIFSYLDALMKKEDKRGPDYKFSVKYRIGTADYEFANFSDIEYVGNRRQTRSNFVYKMDGEPVSVGRMVQPARIIASTMTVTDKFTTVSNGNYIYKGIRNEKSPSTTGTRTMIRKTVSGLLHSLDVKEGFREELIDLLEQMGLEPHVEVGYTLRYKEAFLNEDMSPEMMCHIFDNQREYFPNRQSDLWGTSNFQKLRQDANRLEVVASFLKEKAVELGNRRTARLSYDVLNEPMRIIHDRVAIEALSSLDLLSFPSLRIHKRNADFAFESSSSGETHLLCQLIGIMSDIVHNSIILIDEPENSSHPNWQVSYVGWLKHIFSHYSDCHFVIATHSHFMLTDLTPDSSDIIALVRDDENKLKDGAVGVNTFNWTVDDILYRVFHVRNTRNYVFESRMLELYKMVSERRNKAKIIEIIDELRRFKWNDDDPLVKLIATAEEYVESE